MKFETYLPIFSGFNYTQWEFDYDYIEDFIKQERREKGLFSEIDFNDIKINHNQYEEDIALSLCEVLPSFFEGIIEGVEFECIVKGNVDVSIDINPEKISSFIYDNKELFCKFLKDRYTSYDGFISHYSNDFEIWESETKKFKDFSVNGHYLGSILDFIGHVLKVDNYSLFECIYERIDFFSYVDNLDEMLEYTDNSLYEFFTKNKMDKTWADYIVTSYNNGMINQLCLDEKTLSIIKEFENTLANA